jgi:anthranilate phosphoribosyltransferase
MISKATETLLKKKDLSRLKMERVMEEIMTGKADTSQIVSFLKALSRKGESVDEVTAAVSCMRRHAIKVRARHKTVLDTCGTGGDTKGTFNISTAAAFVAAASGITVAKHGNRSISSFCGSADILEALGIDINMGKDRIEYCLDKIGIAFLFAQNLHPAMKYAMPARKAIGKRTIFNILGPLSNPAQATHQLVGVYERKWTRVLAEVLKNLGSLHVMVVHGEDGLDEITTTGFTHVSELFNGQVHNHKIAPEDFGLRRARLKDLAGGNSSDNAAILMDILDGKRSPKRDIVLLNAGAAIYVADKAKSIKAGIKLAAEAIDSGRALKKLELLKEFSRR